MKAVFAQERFVTWGKAFSAVKQRLRKCHRFRKSFPQHSGSPAQEFPLLTLLVQSKQKLYINTLIAQEWFVTLGESLLCRQARIKKMSHVQKILSPQMRKPCKGVSSFDIACPKQIEALYKDSHLSRKVFSPRRKLPLTSSRGQVNVTDSGKAFPTIVEAMQRCFLI